MAFDNGAPDARNVDRLSAEVETLCYDWRRMRAVIERMTKLPWWDLHTLTCRYCRAPFEVSGEDCRHEDDCVYKRCCEIAGFQPLPLPDQAVLGEWRQQNASTLSF